MPVNVILFRNIVFPNVIMLIRAHSGLGWTPNPMAGVLIRRGRQRHRHKTLESYLKTGRNWRNASNYWKLGGSKGTHFQETL